MVFAFIVMLILFFIIGVPVGVSMVLVAIFIKYIFPDICSFDFNILMVRMVGGINSFVILAVPFFLLVGKLMNTGGITERIFDFARSIVGHFRGGLGHVNVLASLIFSGMTGTAASDVAGLGAIEIKSMEDSGYDTGFAAALTGASASVGPIIPPSIPLVVYGVLTSVSIGKLLISGIIPGLLIGIILMLVVFCWAHIKNYPREKKYSWNKRLRLFFKAIPAIMTPVLLISGILFGFFTPTEAAAVAIVYTLILGFSIKQLNLKKVWDKLQEAAIDSAVLGLILAGATTYGWFLVRTGIPNRILDIVTQLTTNKYIFLILINVFFLIIGCFMETIAALTIFVPTLLPLMHYYEIDPLHMGVVLVLNLMVGLLTPPFGINLFILNRITGKQFEELLKPISIFLIILISIVVILTFIPVIITWLPNLLM
jgi:tripartite ATP-independent transporter DctM subunit